MSTAGSVMRTQWCLMGTGTAGTVPTVTNTTASKRWVGKAWCLSILVLSSAGIFSSSSLMFQYPFVLLICLSQDGDYNKTIPAQHKAHLNHGVFGNPPSSETPKTQQWVNCQMLLCRKCNKNQTTKIKKLASFIPRDDVCTLCFAFRFLSLWPPTLIQPPSPLGHCLFLL